VNRSDSESDIISSQLSKVESHKWLR